MTRQLRPKLLLLAMAKRLGVFALARRLSRDRLRVLCYHGGCMGDESRFNPKLFMHAAQITARLRWLRAHGFTPLSLDSAVRQLQRGEPFPPLPVVVTVDDGWYSSAEHILLPALQQGFPVTLYLATEVMQRQTPVLDVSLRYILWKAGPVRADVSGVPGVQDGHYDLSLPGVRATLASDMLAWLRQNRRDAAGVQTVLEQLAQALGVQPGQLDLDSRRFSYLTGAELQQLHRDGCDVQLHGHTHLYPLGDPQALADDVRRCVRAITQLGLPLPRHYCYPSGTFDADAPRLLAGLGVASATTCVPGMLRPGENADVHLIPRFLDGEDVHPLEFEAEMSGLLEVARALRGRWAGRRNAAGQ